MDNFPASEFMTEFEIAELDNETYENNIRRLFQLRRAREEEEAELNRQEGERFLIQATQEAEIERQEVEAVVRELLDTIFAQSLFSNTLSYRYMGVMPFNTSTTSSESSLILSDDSDYHDDNEESEGSGENDGSGFLLNHDDLSETSEQGQLDIHFQLQNDQHNQLYQNNQLQEDNNDQTETIHNQTQPFPNTDSENEYLMNIEAEKTITKISSNNTSITNSDETFYSPESSIPTDSTASPQEDIIIPHIQSSQETEEQQQTHSNKLISVRQNEITFLRKINSIHKTLKDKPVYIISSVRPNFACSMNQDYFVCHICHFLKRHINYGTKKWKEDDNEYPFIRNIGSIWRHLYYSHCNIGPKIIPQLDKEVRKYVLSYYNNKGFKKPLRKLLDQKTTITKSLSTSCLRTAWKSNQTEISKEIVNTYYFHDNCRGHRRLFFTEGVAHKQDLAISMYCACNAKMFPKEKQQKYYKIQRLQFGNQGEENEINNDHTFFNRESMSIFGVNSIQQIHPTFMVPYKVYMKPLPKLPKYRMTTRSITNKLKIQQEKQDSSINISSIPKNIPINSQRKPPGSRLKAATAKLLNFKRKTPPSDG